MEEEKIYKCAYCGETFRYKVSLDRHLAKCDVDLVLGNTKRFRKIK